MKRQPTTFYRYRAFNTLTLESLSMDQMYFAHPKTFNDPLDCSTDVDCDSSREELRGLLGALIRRRVAAEVSESLKRAGVRGEKATGYAEQRAASEASKVLRRLAYDATDPDYNKGVEQSETCLLRLEIEEELRRYYARGVCCFSTSYANSPLWSHYGDQHQGLCIGYGLDRDPPPSPQRVLYGGNRSIKTSELVAAFVHNDQSSEQAIDKAVLLRKARCWGYEREWRLIGSQGLQDSPMRLKEVTFGLRCSDAVMHAVVEVLKQRQDNVQFFKMYKKPNCDALRRGAYNERENLP